MKFLSAIALTFIGAAKANEDVSLRGSEITSSSHVVPDFISQVNKAVVSSIHTSVQFFIIGGMNQSSFYFFTFGT